MTSGDAYGRAGVSQDTADQAVSRLVGALGAARRQTLLPSGHYANVVAVGDGLGIALTTDGVGTKLLVAEQLGRWDTVGIDCIAMNVNDVICVGAEPIALVDYLAVDEADPEVAEQIGRGLAAGAEMAGIDIVGGELAQLGDIVNGLDLAAACFGVVAPDDLITGSGIQPGDAIIGIPSSGLHSNGYTLARSALEELGWDDQTLGRPLGDALLEPTTIYVKSVMELIRSAVEVRGLAHITSGGLDNLLRLHADVTYEISDPLEPPAIFGLIAERASVSDEEMHQVFNMGCGFCVVVPEGDEPEALSILGGFHPGTRRIGSIAAGDHCVIRVN
jgi:phosphoribosylformylglycinamidine cyclo-ligase